jgi:predicted glycoside hydrolase/deacetylase ChbG (UPF0249 family)
MSQTNKRLGYPDDARLLIINADDFGMCHSTTEAIFRSLREGVVCSTTLMVPCPWASYAMHLLAENPSIAFGIHLTFLGDSLKYPWRPLTCRDKVSSLVDEAGHFYSFDHMDQFVEQVDLDELEVEFRAQIETVLAAHLKPTHLDWHSFRIAKKPEIFELMFRLAREYGLGLRVRERSLIETVQAQGLPVNDYDFLDSYGFDTATKSATFTRLLRELPAGLNEWAVHPGIGNSELQAIEPQGWQVRQADFEFVTSPEAREVIQQEGIILLDYKPIQELWKQY